MADYLEADRALARLLIGRGVFPRDPIEACLQRLEELAAGGQSPLPRLHDLLADRGLLEPVDTRQTVESQRRVGPYLIEGVLGRGGAGVVYRARHERLDRPVALKVLREPEGTGGMMAERFRREALAVAKLQHPAIVAVHDAGEADGVAYLAMEFVDGGPLTEILIGGTMPLRDLIVLLAKVGEAVQHAHEHGVVHRDLKPGNILVDGSGGPRVVDFGLAQMSHVTAALTRSGTALGTPLYMSPEQVSGQAREIGPHSDTFALGVILYEMLTGRVPFIAATIEAVYRRILQDDPIPPRRLRAGVPVDLETICLKALEKPPVRRYPTAGAMAADLKHWLAGEPIVARPPGVVHRTWGRLAKRRVWVASIVAAVAALALATGVFAPRWRVASREAAEEAGRRRESELFLGLEKDLDLLQMKFYQTDFRLTEPEFARYEALVAKVLERMKAGRESAQGWYLIGRCREVTTDYDKADDAYQRALSIDPAHAGSLLRRGRLAIERALLRLAGSSGSVTDAAKDAAGAVDLVRQAARIAGASASMELDMAEAYCELIRTWGHASRYAATPMLEKWKGHAFVEEFLLLEGHASTQPHMVECTTEAIRRMPGYAQAHFWRGAAYGGLGDMRRSIEDFDRALAINPRYARAYFGRGGSHLRAGHVEEALRDFDRALDLNPSFTIAYNNRAIARKDKGDLDGAMADIERALQIDPGYAMAYFNRAAIRSERGDREGALSDYARVIEIDPRHPDVHRQRGVLRGMMGDRDGAMRDLSRAIELNPRDALAYVNRGNVHRRLNQPAEAISDCERALAIDPRCVLAWVNRGTLRALQKDLDGALADYGRALEIDALCVEAYLDRAIVRREKDDLRGAIEDFSRVVEINPHHTGAYQARGDVWQRLGDHGAAIADYSRVLEINPRCADAYYLRGNARQTKGDLAGAIADYGSALEVNPRYAEAFVNRGTARGANGDLRGAVADFTSAIEINPGDDMAYANRGRARSELGDATGAVADWEKVLEVAPPHSPRRAAAQAELDRLKRQQ